MLVRSATAQSTTSTVYTPHCTVFDAKKTLLRVGEYEYCRSQMSTSYTLRTKWWCYFGVHWVGMTPGLNHGRWVGSWAGNGHVSGF